MSHHYSGPDLGFPNGDPRLDITDLYAFPSPGAPGKSILIMNVHPGVTLLSHEPTDPIPFAPRAIYEIKIDTTGDAIADIAYRILFSSTENGAQTATLKRIEGKDAAGTGDSGDVLIAGAPVSIGPEALISEASEYRFFAGWRSDPFSLTRWARSTTCTSLAPIFSLVQMCAALSWKYPTPPWGQELSVSGTAHWMARAEAGYRQTAVRCRRNPSSSQATTKLNTLPAVRLTMRVSFPSSPTRSNTQEVMPLKRLLAWQKHYCRTFCVTTRGCPPRTPRTAEPLQTM